MLKIWIINYYLEDYSDQDNGITKGCFSGLKNNQNNYPTEKNSLYVPNNSFWLYFKSDSETTNWGYKLYVEKTNKYIYETPHPYFDNSEDYKYKYFPKATEILLEFDPRCSTEKNQDYLQLIKIPPNDLDNDNEIFNISIR